MGWHFNQAMDSEILDDMSDLYDDCDSSGDCVGYAPRKKTCRRCGKSGLVWSTLNGKWRLADESGRIHYCAPVRLSD